MKIIIKRYKTRPTEGRMRSRDIFIFATAVLCMKFLASCAQATDLLEPYLDVYGTIRPTVMSKEGDSLTRAKFNLNRLFINIDKDFSKGIFGFHTLTEYQQGKKGNFPNEWWLEEGYFYFNPRLGTIKAGKVYTPFGIIWDNTFYSSAVYYKGYMGDPDYGLTFEKSETVNKNTELKCTAGYFVRDDGLNGETAIGTGYEFLNKGERSTFVGRLNPRIKISEKSSLELGFSVLTGRVKGVNAKRQAASEADAVYKYGPLTLSAECVFYDKAYPKKDDTLRGYVYYLEPGLCVYSNPKSKLLKGINLNYNYSKDNPDSCKGVGQIHLPSVMFKFTYIFKTELLYADWTNDGTTVDRSWWLIFYLEYRGRSPRYHPTAPQPFQLSLLMNPACILQIFS